MNQLTNSVVVREVEFLLGDRGLVIDDFEIVLGGVLVCKSLPGNGWISGGIRLSDSCSAAMSINEFSNRILAPWMTRMARLKALQEDLKALGVEV